MTSSQGSSQSGYRLQYAWFPYQTVYIFSIKYLSNYLCHNLHLFIIFGIFDWSIFYRWVIHMLLNDNGVHGYWSVNDFNVNEHTNIRENHLFIHKWHFYMPIESRRWRSKYSWGVQHATVTNLNFQKCKKVFICVHLRYDTNRKIQLGAKIGSYAWYKIDHQYKCLRMK